MQQVDTSGVISISAIWFTKACLEGAPEWFLHQRSLGCNQRLHFSSHLHPLCWFPIDFYLYVAFRSCYSEAQIAGFQTYKYGLRQRATFGRERELWRSAKRPISPHTKEKGDKKRNRRFPKSLPGPQAASTARKGWISSFLCLPLRSFY